MRNEWARYHNEYERALYISLKKVAEKILERKILGNLDLISGKTVFEVGVIMNLVGLRNAFSYFFQFGGGFFEQVNGLPMGFPLSPLLANCSVKNIEIITLDSNFKDINFRRDIWMT